MDFFKSVFADEPDSPRSESETESNPNPPQKGPDSNPQSSNPSDGGGGSPWSFGGLMKTLTSKSESVIEIYRRDIMEFGSGLKKEIEVAHGSIETVSHKIDEIGTSVLKGTAQIISQGKEAILAVDHESDSDNSDRNVIGQQHSLNSKPYSRFDAQVRAIQGDLSTFVEEPEDLDEYKKWRSGFVVEEKRDEIENLIGENGELESVFKKIVPSSVDEENFWCRYYFRVYKLKQAEDLRASLVKRAISAEEEDLSWDVDDDDDEDGEFNRDNEKGKDRNLQAPNAQSVGNEDLRRDDPVKIAEAGEGNDIEEKDRRESEQNANMREEKDVGVEELKEEKALNSEDNVVSDEIENLNVKEQITAKPDDKAGVVAKGDNGDSPKDSEFSVVASHQSTPEEEDLGWDEIEDLSSIDEKKVNRSGSPSAVDLRKRLSAAEEEDLSWDIEDDDDDIKS